MTLYQYLNQELRAARRLMVSSFGTDAHRTYRTLCRLIENDIKKLTVNETISA